MKYKRFSQRTFVFHGILMSEEATLVGKEKEFAKLTENEVSEIENTYR
jgi:hypothetical protein